MPSPIERLEKRLAATSCNVCKFLEETEDPAGWRAAIADTRFGHKMVADEINLDGEFTQRVSEDSVRRHRERRHK